MKAIIDMHTHTVASGHAYSTIHENIQFAKKHGMKFLGTSDHVNFKLEKNEHIGLVGANGEGKTTFFKLITNELLPDSGTIYWNNKVEEIAERETELVRPPIAILVSKSGG